MKPEIIHRQVAHAQAVAAGMHDAALLCKPEQAALSARLMGGARQIDALVALVESLLLIATINAETIKNRETV